MQLIDSLDGAMLRPFQFFERIRGVSHLGRGDVGEQVFGERFASYKMKRRVRPDHVAAAGAIKKKALIDFSDGDFVQDVAAGPV